MPKACLLTLFAMWTSHTWVVEANQEYYWKVHNHANIQLICIKIYIIASNNKTKQKKKPKNDTFMEEKLFRFYWFFKELHLLYSKIEMHIDKPVDKN